MVLRIEAGIAYIELLIGGAGLTAASNWAVSHLLGADICRTKGRRVWKGANDAPQSPMPPLWGDAIKSGRALAKGRNLSFRRTYTQTQHPVYERKFILN